RHGIRLRLGRLGRGVRDRSGTRHRGDDRKGCIRTVGQRADVPDAGATGAMFQARVTEVKRPTLGAAETKARPAGSRSVTCTPVALLGPLLVAVMVKSTGAPRFGRVLSTVFARAMSAETGLMEALAESLASAGSGWSSALLVAVFVAVA